jgi:hypothetical protein
MGSIYTVGYGLLTGSHEERKVSFQKRLEYIQRGIGKRLFVVDIRKAGSGSRNGPHFSQGIDMVQMVRKLSGDGGKKLEETITYIGEPDLANEYGGCLRALRAYSHRLKLAVDYMDGDLSGMSAAFFYMVSLAKKQDCAVLLMCGCKDAFKKNGTTPNCHRVPLADALVGELGDGWSVVHL